MQYDSLCSGSDRNTTVIAFGTRLTADVDEGKLQCLKVMGYDVVSVNDANSLEKNHVCADFKEVRGLTSVGARIVAETAKDKVIAVLDHSWLECNYYKERYGMNWLSKKASILLNYGVSQVFLPRDKHGEIEKMLAGKHSDDIRVRTTVRDQENLLFVAASKYIATLDTIDKKNASGRINDYTIAGQRFIEITRFFLAYVGLSTQIAYMVVVGKRNQPANFIAYCNQLSNFFFVLTSKNVCAGGCWN